MSDPSTTDQHETRQVDRASTAMQPTPAVPPTLQPTLTGSQVDTALATVAGDVPQRIGRYQVVRLLGRGAMGSVYLAHDTQLDRPVALKVPNSSMEGNPEALERFYREARSAGRLHHPNICPVYDVNCVDGVHYLTMGYIDGPPLSAKVAEFAGRSERDAAGLVRTLALALEEAHRQGVIHRDLKPGNVMLTSRGEPVVMDFGLARETKTGDAGQTHEGMILGTPAYMPPEQARGDVTAMGPGCDIYSLGVILYELLAGQLPFRGNTMDVITQQIRDEPPPPRTHRPTLDPNIEAICLKALAKQPSQRFLSMAEFAQCLADYLAGTPSQRPLEEADPLGPVFAEALLLFRTWGWEAGIRKIRAQFTTTAADVPQARFDLLLEWMGGADAVHDKALAEFKTVRAARSLAGWAVLGQLDHARSRHDHALEKRLLDQAESSAESCDNVLRACIGHHRGAHYYHLGRVDDALPLLLEALALLGRTHYLTGWLLDTLGMVYAAKNNFHAAHEFFQQAISCKEHFGDELSIALSHGQLGRLHLDWGLLDRAEEHFQRDLELVSRNRNEQAQSQIFNHLGQVELARAERELTVGRKNQAKRHLTRAAEWIDGSIRAHKGNNRMVQAAYAHKDRAWLCLAEDDLPAAEQHIQQAEELFKNARFDEGKAKIQVVAGVLARRQSKYQEAEQALEAALAWLDKVGELAEAARAQLELARTIAAAGAIKRLVSAAFLDALRRAEACRRPDLVRLVEEELRGADEEAHWHHVFDRVRGKGAPDDTSSLVEGISESASVLFLDLQGFIPFCQGLDSQDVMVTLNQLLADLGVVLDRHRASVTAFLGGGFMALAREANHAERAVQAALDLVAVIRAFNRPREVLGLRLLPARISVASGTVTVGNIGTYLKMDFTAVGPAVNLAARLVRFASPEMPCVSQETWEMVRGRFAFSEKSPRSLDLPGIGRRDVWDVAGRRIS